MLFITLFDTFYCFPYALPTNAEIMNYNSVILVGVVVITMAWWVVHARRSYPGPKVMGLYVVHDDQVLHGAAPGGGQEAEGFGEKKGKE